MVHCFQAKSEDVDVGMRIGVSDGHNIARDSNQILHGQAEINQRHSYDPFFLPRDGVAVVEGAGSGFFLARAAEVAFFTSAHTSS